MEPVASLAPVEADPGLTDFADDGDEARALADLGALSAWSAVIERDRFLSRRGQTGVVYGLLVESQDGLHLIDEAEGQGSLWIHVTIPVEIQTPERAILWGGWHLQSQTNSWVWKADRVERLVPRPESQPILQSLDPREFDRPPDCVLASQASDRGGPIEFVVLERGTRLGDGWLIADEPEGPAIARLLLPGEREPYGGQSIITDAERWKLRPGERYWITIKRFRRRASQNLPVFRARGAPSLSPGVSLSQDLAAKESTQ